MDRYKSDFNLGGSALLTLYSIARAERHFFLTCSIIMPLPVQLFVYNDPQVLDLITPL